MTYAGYTPPSTSVASFSSQVILPNGWRPDLDYDLLVALHNYGSSGSGLLTRLLWTAAHNFKRGFIVWAPTGPVDGSANTHWNYWDNTSPGNHFGLIRAGIVEIMSKFRIRKKKWTGYSNGALFIEQLMQRDSDLIDAAVMMACQGGVNDPMTPLATPIPCVHWHGPSDAVILAAGDPAGVLPGTLTGHGGVGSTGYKSTVNSVAARATRNGLTGSLGSAGTPFNYATTGTGTDETVPYVWNGSGAANAVEYWEGVGCDHAFTAATTVALYTWLATHEK